MPVLRVGANGQRCLRSGGQMPEQNDQRDGGSEGLLQHWRNPWSKMGGTHGKHTCWISERSVLCSDVFAVSSPKLHFLRKICHFNHPNLVRFIEEFKYKGIPCLVLEILHNDMFRTVKNQEWEVQLNKIRLIAKQVRIVVNWILKPPGPPLSRDPPKIYMTFILGACEIIFVVFVCSCLWLWTRSVRPVLCTATSNRTTSCLSARSKGKLSW